MPLSRFPLSSPRSLRNKAKKLYARALKEEKKGFPEKAKGLREWGKKYVRMAKEVERRELGILPSPLTPLLDGFRRTAYQDLKLARIIMAEEGRTEEVKSLEKKGQAILRKILELSSKPGNEEYKYDRLK